MRRFGGKLQREMIFLLATVFTGEINQSLTLVDIRILDTDKEDNKIQMWRCVFYTENYCFLNNLSFSGLFLLKD